MKLARDYIAAMKTQKRGTGVVPVGIGFEPAVYAKILAAAKREGASISVVVNDLVRKGLAK